MLENVKKYYKLLYYMIFIVLTVYCHILYWECFLYLTLWFKTFCSVLGHSQVSMMVFFGLAGTYILVIVSIYILSSADSLAELKLSHFCVVVVVVVVVVSIVY